jgi:acetyl esterase/lipase
MNESTSARSTEAGSPDQRWISALLRVVLRTTLRRTFRAGLSVEQQRLRLQRVTRLTLPPRGATFTASSLGGVPGEWVGARGHERPSLTLLYLHGGGYTTGSPSTHRALTGHLAVRCDARVFAADYRLAPEHPFPAALDDAVAAWRGLVGEGLEAGRIAIAGDSAGGGLAVATALRLRALGAPMPCALVLFSPWVDLTLERLSAAPPGEVMLTLPWVRECAGSYVGRADSRHPLISPIEADLRALPPTLVQVGTDELLLPDSRRLYERMRAAGTPAELSEFPGRWHVFQANAGVLADADRALEAVARFLRDAAAASEPPSIRRPGAAQNAG